MEKIAPVSDARTYFPRIIDEIKATNNRYVVTKRGKPAIILIAPEELETLEILANKKLMKSLIRAEEDVKEGRIHSHKEVFADA